MMQFPRTKAEWRIRIFGQNSEWKKNARIYVGAGSILAAICSAPVAWRELVTKPAERERWGTVTNPAFRIKNSTAAEIRINRFEDLLSGKYKKLQAVEGEIQKISRYFSSPEGQQLLQESPGLYTEIEKKLLSPSEDSDTSPALLPARKSANTAEHLEACARRGKGLFEEMTGEELPKRVTFKYIKAKENRLGYTRSFSSVVHVCGSQTPDMLLSTIMHEFGHLICRISEENGRSFENASLEEACAFSFEMSAAFTSADNYVQEAFFTEFDTRLSDWYDGERNDPHAKGAAICEAATFLYGGPGAAFNQLYTGSLDPALILILEENQSRWNRYRDLHNDIQIRARELLRKTREISRPVSR